MPNSRRQEGRKGGRQKDQMRAFVCNSNITYQQITGQRCLMKMRVMDVGGWREEGRDGKSRHGLLGNSKVFVSAATLLPRARVPRLAGLGLNPKSAT